MPEPGLKISFQKEPTTTGESIIGIRINVVTKPLARNFSRNNIAKPKPSTVCAPTDKNAKRPVVAKYFHIWGSFSSLLKLAKPIQIGALFGSTAEKSVKLK